MPETERRSDAEHSSRHRNRGTMSSAHFPDTSGRPRWSVVSIYASSGRLIPNVLGGMIGAQVIDSWKTGERFVPPKTALLRTPNTMFAVQCHV